VKRFLLALVVFTGAMALALNAQTPDSTRTDSVAVWSKHTTEWYSHTVVETDTVEVPRPLATGVDSLTKGDTTFYAFWSERITKTEDSAKVVVRAPAKTFGKPFGPADLFDVTNPAPFTYNGGESSALPKYLLENIVKARQKRIAFIANLPCGSHSSIDGGRCMSLNANGVWTFDRVKYVALLEAFNTPEVRTAVAQAYREGWLVGINLMDEPWVSGGDDGAGTVVPNSWGPKGTVTKAVADGLCVEAKRIFPEVPVGMSESHRNWDTSNDLKVCDIGIEQFSYRFGDPVAWREAALAKARRGGSQRVFSFNIINGGTQDKTGTWDCPGIIKGSRSPNCGMTEAQIKQVVEALGDLGCGGLMMWKYDATRFARPDWKRAFEYGAALQAQREARPCTRR
jgi:hypothetical protein